jgi:hypothetical protein
MGNAELEADVQQIIKTLQAPVSEPEKGEGWTSEKKTKWQHWFDAYLAKIRKDEIVEPMSSAIREMHSDGVDPSKISELVGRVVFKHGLTRR